jgi:hypothetical protein
MIEITTPYGLPKVPIVMDNNRRLYYKRMFGIPKTMFKELRTNERGQPTASYK